MKMIAIPKKEWPAGLAKAAGSFRLFGPVKEKEFHSFKRLENGQLPDFSCQNTRLSPKHLVYPQSEVMLTYSLDESRPDHHIMKEAPADTSPRAVLGIRPCDAKAFVLVRMNFDTPDYKDPYWLRAYESTTFVGLSCASPCSSCFCTTAGCGPFHEEGLDVLLADAGDHFLAKVLTEKGAAWVAAGGWTQTADAKAEGRLADLRQAAEAKIASQVQTESLKAADTTALYNAGFWEEVSFACINCGTCTYSCPTCWCFDIQDETRGTSGVRMKNWDSCMYPLFTLHGTGHNPRGTKLHRVRQRFMHKLKYFVDKYDRGIQCVGCGRCVRLCPVNIDIRRVCGLMNGLAASGEACAID
ncbi:MAG: 4Fe-4S dicluster domain-containing protein [Desulfobacterales bacterium]|jgi:ferredoxin|nr:4Fe-4S dicluster domain-containing protein [Desulfobacterales bacterium]